jgi:hypothetical protein
MNLKSEFAGLLDARLIDVVTRKVSGHLMSSSEAMNEFSGNLSARKWR